MTKRILVTGADGFVGSHLLDGLLAEGGDVHLAGAAGPGTSRDNVRHLGDSVEWFDVELIDPHCVAGMIEALKPDEVYHLASMAAVAPSWKMPAAYLQVNAIGTIHLFEALRTNRPDARVLVTGSADIYGRSEDGTATSEASPTNAVNPYAASKVAQDAICTAYHASYGMHIVRTRAMNHDGPRRALSGVLASFAYQIARIEAKLAEPIIRVGNLDAVRSFTHVRDIVRAYQLAMTDALPGEVYLIGTNDPHSIHECLDTLVSMSTRKDITHEVDPARLRPVDSTYTAWDCSKFEAATGWQPEIEFEGILADVLEYWRGVVRTERM